MEVTTFQLLHHVRAVSFPFRRCLQVKPVNLPQLANRNRRRHSSTNRASKTNYPVPHHACSTSLVTCRTRNTADSHIWTQRWFTTWNLKKPLLGRFPEDKQNRTSSTFQTGEEKSERRKLKGDISVESCHTRQKQVLEGSARVVLLAVGSNTVLMSAKLTAAIMTGSSSMMSEALHSLADVGNELLLLWGIRRSMKDPDVQHPYGFSRERYAWALVSGVGIFFLGCGVSLYHGISGMLYPSEIVDPHIAYAVLGASLFFEGGTMVAALRQVKKSAAQTQVSLKEYVLRGADPTAVQVLLEDTAAVAGVFIAGTSLTLAIYTGNPIYDAAGSVGIGLLLGNVAGFLVKRNVSLLVETSMDSRRMKEVVDILESDPVVRTVHDVKSTSLGPEWARFKAEVQFDGGEVTRRRLQSLPSEYLSSELVKAQGLSSEEELKEFLIAHGAAGIESLAREVDRVESQIQEKVPEVKHCDLEIL